jgi:NADH dehydrogenase
VEKEQYTVIALKGSRSRPRAVIVGGGFGGLNAVKSLAKADLDIVLLDKTNHHLFQPLLYQTATAALSPGEIAEPIRAIFRKQKNVLVVMREVVAVDKEKQQVVLNNETTVEFDYLILAPGARHSYFGNDRWETHAPGLKTLTDALTIREKALLSFERAEVTQDPLEQRAYLTFVVVGAGPTGVEMAGAIAEVAHKTISQDFRNINPTATRVLLVEGLDRVLPTYSPGLSQQALKSLKQLGVEVSLNSRVSNVTADGVQVGDEWIATPNIIWAAGNVASPLLKTLSIDQDTAGRVMVEPDLSIPGYPGIFVIGDAAHFQGKSGPLPGVAPVAIQQGKHAAQMIRHSLAGKDRIPFRFRDRGTMATIGRAKAVAQVGKLGFSGLLAWLAWSLVHVVFLIGYRNKVLVMVHWISAYITYQRSARLITDRSSSGP